MACGTPISPRRTERPSTSPRLPPHGRQDRERTSAGAYHHLRDLPSVFTLTGRNSAQGSLARVQFPAAHPARRGRVIAGLATGTIDAIAPTHPPTDGGKSRDATEAPAHGGLGDRLGLTLTPSTPYGTMELSDILRLINREPAPASCAFPGAT